MSDAERRALEFEALQAIYEDELEGEAAGPWRIRLCRDAVLEVHVPMDYPSREPPTPLISSALPESVTAALAEDLLAIYAAAAGDEVVFQWVEHCREAVAASASSAAAATAAAADDAELQLALQAVELAGDAGPSGAAEEAGDGGYVHAAPAAPDRVPIHHGEPFHPPKSGPGETFLAHVARVTSEAQVRWVLAELLSDRRIARATHNMSAYRLWDGARGVQVSDNDDDGESGSGAKLAALLELTGSQDVLVVVSRWYGGVHLGPARFKYIAACGRAALEAAGLIGGGGGGGGERTAAADRKPRRPKGSK
jgi:hypothetical protein